MSIAFAFEVAQLFLIGAIAASAGVLIAIWLHSERDR